MILVAAAVILWLVFSQKKEDPGRQAAGLVVSDEAEEWNKELEDTSGGQQGIKIPGYGEITVASGETHWNITLLNPVKATTVIFSTPLPSMSRRRPSMSPILSSLEKPLQNFRYQNPWRREEYEIHLNISAYTMDENLSPLKRGGCKGCSACGLNSRRI